MVRNTFKINVIYNEGETITTEYTKPKKQDTIEEVNMNQFDKETEDNQREQVNISCKVEEPEPEEVKEPEPEEQQEEEQKINKTLSIEELKEILTEKLEKKNTALSYGRTIKQVYDYFRIDDIYRLLKKNKKS